MNFINLNNPDLVSRTKSLVAEERNLTTELIQYLREIEKRKIHLSYGYSSLHEFCVKHLGYSDGGAYRRISAMRLIKEIPEVEAKIKNGSLSLTNASMAHNFFKHEKKQNNVISDSKKIELIQKLENQSTRQTEKILVALSPNPIPKEKVRILTVTKTEIKIILDEKTKLKLEKIKQLLSNTLEDQTYGELLDKMSDIVLEKIEPKQVNRASAPKLDLESHTRYIPKQIKQEIKIRDENRCQFISPITGKRCEERKYLEFDHVKPFSQGGATSINNLRLTCSSHNKFEAIQKLGEGLMGKYS